MLLYRISPVSIKPVLKSVTNSIYTYPIDIQIHFPSTKENFQSNIFTFNFYFCTTIYASQAIFPKKEEGKRGGEKKKGETTELTGHSNILRSIPTFH